MDRRRWAHVATTAALLAGAVAAWAPGAAGQGASATLRTADNTAPAAPADPAKTDPAKIEPPKSDPAKPDGSAPPQKADASNPKTAPSTGTSAVVVDLSALESVIGKSVKSAAGEDLGRIVDLLVTTSGQVRAAVIDFGGILGVGSRKVAVDWKALDFSNFTKDGTVRLGLTRNQVRVSPEYKSGEPVVILQEGKPDDGKAEPAKPDSAKPDKSDAGQSKATPPPNNGETKAPGATGSQQDGVSK